MAEAATKSVAKSEQQREPTTTGFRPFLNLRRKIDRLFDDFAWGSSWRSPSPHSLFDVEPFWRGDMSWAMVPAVDIADSEKGYEITVELPGMDEKNVEVKFTNGVLTVKGESRKRRKKRARTTICQSGVMARSSGLSQYQMASMRKRSRQRSRMAY